MRFLSGDGGQRDGQDNLECNRGPIAATWVGLEFGKFKQKENNFIDLNWSPRHNSAKHTYGSLCKAHISLQFFAFFKIVLVCNQKCKISPSKCKILENTTPN